MMFAINLLPWRDSHRRYLVRRYLQIIWLVILGITLATILMVMHLNKLIDDQKSQQQLLQQTIADHQQQLEKLGKYQNATTILLKKLRLWQRRQQQYIVLQQILVKLATILPVSLFLSRLTFKPPQLILVGRAATTTAVSRLIRNFRHSSDITQTTLIHIKRIPQYLSYLNEFKLQLDINDEPHD